MSYYNNSILLQNKTQVNFSIFVGNYPSVFKHTCEEKIALVGNDSGTKRISLNNRVWRERDTIDKCGNEITLPQCQGCLHDHVYRNCKQIEIEMIFNYDVDWFWINLYEKEFGNFRRNSSKKKNNLRYIAIPQSNKSLMVIHNNEELGGKQIPYNLTKLYQLVKRTINKMPKQTKIRKSQGFGRQYKGMRGYGEDELKPELPYLLVPNNKKEFIEFLRQTDVNTLEISMLELMILLDTNFIGYRVYGEDTRKLWEEKRRLLEQNGNYDLQEVNVEPPEPDFTEWTPPEYNYTIMEDEPVGW